MSISFYILRLPNLEFFLTNEDELAYAYMCVFHIVVLIQIVFLSICWFYSNFMILCYSFIEVSTYYHTS